MDTERIELVPGLIIEIDTARFQVATLPMMLMPVISDFTLQIDLQVVDVLEGDRQRIENALKLRSR